MRFMPQLVPRYSENERGFTLIELMVVTVVVGILAGIAGVQYRGMQVRAHLTSVVADARILFHGLEEFYTVNYRYPNATSNPAFNLVTFEPLRTLVGYQGSINARLLNGQADAYDSPDDQGPNQEWWLQMTLAIDPSFQVVIAMSDNVDLLPGTWLRGVFTFEDGTLIAGPGVQRQPGSTSPAPCDPIGLTEAATKLRVWGGCRPSVPSPPSVLHPEWSPASAPARRTPRYR